MISRPRFKAARTFTSGRKGIDNAENEDGILCLDTPHGALMLVVDGMTPQTDWATALSQGKVTSGWLAKEAVIAETRELTPENTNDFLFRVFSRWQNVRAQYAVPDDEIIGAAFVIYIPWLNEIHQLADCVYGFETGTEWLPCFEGFSAVGTLANLRAEKIQEMFLLKGASSLEEMGCELAAHGWEHLQRARYARHIKEGSWVDDFAGVEKRYQCTPVPGGTQRMIICSDGFQAVPRSLEEGFALLERIRTVDPLTIGLDIGGGMIGPRTPKGFIDAVSGKMHPYPDDLAFIEACLVRD